MIIKTAEPNSFKPFLKNISIPKANSHKGQNGRVLIVGGSSLFHAASIWAAEVASHFVDMVHYSSTKENNEVFLSLKNKFRNGMVVRQEQLLEYVKEDDAILVGPGLIRGKITNYELRITNFNDLLKIKSEPTYTYYLAKYLLENFPDKKFVLDAGTLQMMKPDWLLKLKAKPIITPHQGEFEKLFGLSVNQLSVDQKTKAVKEMAKKYNCIILLKAVIDFISDGEKTVIVEGGNAGLTKGGTGDILAGLCVSFLAKNNAFDSAVLSSIILKKSAEALFLRDGYWYNIDDIIEKVPAELKKLLFIT